MCIARQMRQLFTSHVGRPPRTPVYVQSALGECKNRATIAVDLKWPISLSSTTEVLTNVANKRFVTHLHLHRTRLPRHRFASFPCVETWQGWRGPCRSASDDQASGVLHGHGALGSFSLYEKITCCGQAKSRRFLSGCVARCCELMQAAL